MSAEDSVPIIDVSDLDFGYSEGEPVISGVSFSIEKPEFVCIIGPNGVGKSTLIKCINGILKPTKGKVSIYGRDVKDYTLKELAHIIGYVPVVSNDYNVMTVLDTVMVGRYARQKWKANEKDILISHRALEAMEVDDLSMRYFNELSAGQHQKVAIARGLVQEPRILILDEPTSNLDIRHQIYVSSFLSKLSKRTGTTVIMISHDLNLAARFADRVIVMERPGRIYSVGAPKDVFTEDMIRDVYNVSCSIVDDDGSPHVILKNVFRPQRR